jgi:hypothetical protein
VTLRVLGTHVTLQEALKQSHGRSWYPLNFEHIGNAAVLQKNLCFYPRLIGMSSALIVLACYNNLTLSKV